MTSKEISQQATRVVSSVLAVCFFTSCAVMGRVSTLRLDGSYPRCEPITVKMCKDMRYNLTRMPNLAGQDNQIEAEARIQDFLPLVQTNCSPLLKFFLCSLYAPMCTELVGETLTIPACKSMCLQVKSKCEPLLQTFNFEWPEMLACEKLPEKSDPRNNLCMAAPNGTGEPDLDSGPLLRARLQDIHTDLGKLDTNLDWRALLKEKFIKNPHLLLTSDIAKEKDPVSLLPDPCPPRFVFVDNIPSSNNACAPRCDVDVLFRHEDKKFAEAWITVWASLCFVSTLLTVATCAVDPARFRYPERPIIFLAVCYLLQSVAYIIRAAIGAEAVSCDTAKDGGLFVIQEGLENAWCIIVFLLLYFFGMASCIWWVVLAITWFLASGQKWGQQAIEGLSSYFHMAAWTIPAVKTIILVTMRRVDGDELTGLCYVGNQHPMFLTFFVLIPLLVYLLAGLVFILAGFASMMRIRRNLKQDGSNGNIRKLEKLMAKVSVYSVLYTVPAVCVIGCHFYERINFEHWRKQAMSLSCPVQGSSHAASEDSQRCPLEHSIPTSEIYMLKLFMSLVIGITSGMWVWSGKTVNSWRGFFSRRLFRRKTNNFHIEYRPGPPVIMLKNSQYGGSKISSHVGSHTNTKVLVSNV
ncbi:unnamed protein product [Candidula unifasciata]|uniref:Uncharacterized protein n=1 Tax=Candidula unifasciata TaxID=100452 RepID=A0A8S3ZCE0_9EUPU|nr:unnamed protein product [Candidula unifasciata]